MIPPIPSPGWSPAPGRTLLIPNPDQVRGAIIAPPSLLVWNKKTSSDNLDFSLDPSEWLDGTDDYLSRIELVEVTTAAGEDVDMKCLWSSIVSGMACMMFGGGQSGSQQTIHVHLLTQQGRRHAVSVILPVIGLLPSAQPQVTPQLEDATPVPPNAIQLPDESILLDESGELLLIA